MKKLLSILLILTLIFTSILLTSCTKYKIYLKKTTEEENRDKEPDSTENNNNNNNNTSNNSNENSNNEIHQNRQNWSKDR